MDTNNNIFSKILASILGIIIFGSVISLLFVIILTIFFLIAKPESISDWLLIIYSLIGLLNIVFGIYLGLKSYKSKNIWYTIFRPSKNKALISLLLSIILVISLLVFSGNKPFVSSRTLQPVSLIVAIPLSIISYFIAFYPFSALCIFVYKYKKDKLFKKSKAVVIILLILLNPIFIVFGGAIGAVYREAIINEPCGLKIVAFDEISPAKDSGMQVGEVIIKVNDVEIDSFKELDEFMDAYDPSMDLIIHTKLDSYSIEPYFQDGEYKLGLHLTTEMCKRSFPLFLNSSQIKNTSNMNQRQFINEYNLKVEKINELLEEHDILVNEINSVLNNNSIYYQKLENYLIWVEDNREEFINFKSYVERNYKQLRRINVNPDYARDNIKQALEIIQENEMKFRETLAIYNMFQELN